MGLMAVEHMGSTTWISNLLDLGGLNSQSVIGYPIPVASMSTAQCGLHISSSVMSHVSSTPLHFAACLSRPDRHNWCFGGGRGDLQTFKFNESIAMSVTLAKIT